ncbi:DNA-processing protein DprA [Gallintestinimicrobium sp.]|uniref:DNA-processing protein DprA n=1 Tax=Gallintestinimicrobium sp. TaxID=2981655 RepID=UPI0039947058
MERIEEKGLLLSEYPPGVRPSQYTFPRRNRLISAWSDKLIVIGAGNRSGAHIA